MATNHDVPIQTNSPIVAETPLSVPLRDEGTVVWSPDVDVLDEAKDRVRWGPIVAGIVTTIASMVVFTVLGLAIGASIFEPPGEGSTVGIFPAVYAALSGLLAFAFGGFMAGRTAAVGRDSMGLLNGFLVGATVVALILWMTGTGVGNVLGGLGSNVADVARLGTEQAQSGQVDAGQAQAQAQDAANRARQAAVDNYDKAKGGAWGALAGLVLALGAATLGGFLGHRALDPGETVERTSVNPLAT